MIRLAALAAMALVLGSNAYAAEPEAEIKGVEIARVTFSTGVTVIHDDKRAVTCWVYKTEEGVRYDIGGGISCIPDWMLTAPKGGMAVRP